MSPPIYTPDGSEVSEIVLPDGSTASEVIGPDGNVVFEAGPDIPDSAVSQYVASEYDTNNDAWIDQIGSNDLTGGSGTLTTDSNGNTAVEYSGSSTSQIHDSTSLSANYDRFAVAIVYQLTDTSNVQRAWDSDGSDPEFIVDNGSNIGIDFGGGKAAGGTPDTNTHLALAIGPDFNQTSTDLLEIDGSTIVSSDVGSNSFSGFALGGSQQFGQPMYGYVSEVVIYENPTKSEITDEKTRLQDKYSGI